MEALVFFTNKNSIKQYLDELMITWELSLEKTHNIAIGNKKVFFIYDGMPLPFGNNKIYVITNDIEATLKKKASVHKKLVNNLIKELLNYDYIYIIYHSYPNEPIINTMVCELKDKGKKVIDQKEAHTHKETYQKISSIHINEDNSDELEKIFCDIKKYLIGDVDLETKLNFLHNLLTKETIEDGSLLIEKFNIKNKVAQLINNKNGCFDKNYINTLKDIREIVLGN